MSADGVRQVIIRAARPGEYAVVGKLRVAAYRAFGLLLAVIECAAKRGIRTLRLCTQPAMRSAQHLYESTGFSRTPDLDFEPEPGLTLRATSTEKTAAKRARKQ